MSTSWVVESEKLVCEPNGAFCFREIALIGMCGKHNIPENAILPRMRSGESSVIGCPVARNYLKQKAAEKWPGKKVSLLTSVDGKQLRVQFENQSITVDQGTINEEV